MALTKVTGSGADGLTLSSTDVTVASGDLLFGTSGKGPVIGSTSNTDANTLDDYEEGTYEVAMTCATSGTITLNSSKNTLSYTKVGRLVTINGRFQVSSVSSPSGELRISLPFVSADLGEETSRASIPAYCMGYDAEGGTISHFGDVAHSQSFATLVSEKDNADFAASGFAAGVAANDLFYMNGSYVTSA